MEFTQLDERHYPEFLKLYNSAFPADERRIYDDTDHFAGFVKEKGGKFHAFAAEDGGVFLAFLSYWTFEGYVYVEHFAVSPAHRGKRIGSLMLRHLIKTVSPNILIEVELPETDEARRRIDFYEKQGFRTREEIKYVQPPYSSSQKPVEMLLMTHGEVDLHNSSTIGKMLAEVYNVREGA